jgi:hypothetical protein
MHPDRQPRRMLIRPLLSTAGNGDIVLRDVHAMIRAEVGPDQHAGNSFVASRWTRRPTVAQHEFDDANVGGQFDWALLLPQ